jgi:EmrB/QacA subfamily drug resistance transporter
VAGQQGSIDAAGTVDGVPAEVYARRWRILGVLCLSLTIVMVGNSTLNVALPSLTRQLGASNTELQWIVDAYGLVFAGLLFPAGAIGDRFGRKRTLQTGLFVFLVGSVLATMSDSSGQLIFARAVMGAAAAFVMPSTLSSLTTAFPARERARAIGMWAGVSAAGAAIGPVASGLLLEHFWWGSVFLVNIPLIVLAIVLGRRLVPESRNPAGHPLDLPGAGLAMVAVTALVFAIIEAPTHGWTAPATLAAFAVSALAGVAFVVRERTAAHPMLPLQLFRDRRFSVSSAGIALAFFAMFGTWFLTAQYLQFVLGLSPLQAGLVFLPFSVIILLASPQAPKFVVRFGGRAVASTGFVCVAIGLFAFSRLGVDSPVWAIYLSIVPMAFGMAIVTSPLTAAIMTSVPPGIAGVGSAMNDTTRELGGALGVAVLGSITTTRFATELAPSLSGLPDASRDLASSGLAGVSQVASGVAGPAGDVIRSAADVAFVNALHTATLIAAVAVLLAAVGARLLLPRVTLGAAHGPGPDGGGPPGPRADGPPPAAHRDAATSGQRSVAPPDAEVLAD